MLQGICGLIVFVVFAWACAPRAVRMPVRQAAKIAGIGIGLQFAIAAALLYIPLFTEGFKWLGQAVTALQSATEAGTSFVFGYLGGAALPFTEREGASSFILAIRALPLVLVVSALSALLFHWRILPVIVRGFSWALAKSMGVGGAVSVSVAANIFVGMVEAPLLVRPYLQRLTRSELFTVMVSGMATIAGTVMILYASILGGILPGALGHLLTASLISAPAAVLVSRLMLPETGDLTPGDYVEPDPPANAMDALTRGTLSGVGLLINITAMLIVFVALVALINMILAALGGFFGYSPTLQGGLGYLMAPVAWLMGLPWNEAIEAGRLLGVKIILNEFLAYLNLVSLPETAFSEKNRLIVIYGLCGFANFGSLGIMVGGLTSIVPERRAEIVSLGLRSIVAGTIAACMTGTVVGLVLVF